MGIVFAVMVALNMVQVNKDAARCKKAYFKSPGCSVFVKLGMDKVK